MSVKPAGADTLELDRPKLPPRRRHNPWFGRALIFVTCVLVADALFGDRGLAAMLRARREHRQAATELTRFRYENAALREQVRRFLEDPTAIEAIARRELGLVRPGEILVVVRDVR